MTGFVLQALAEYLNVNQAFRHQSAHFTHYEPTGAGQMTSRTQPIYEPKQAKTEPAPQDAASDLCGQYRGIGIAAVAAAACAGKSQRAG